MTYRSPSERRIKKLTQVGFIILLKETRNVISPMLFRAHNDSSKCATVNTVVSYHFHWIVSLTALDSSIITMWMTYRSVLQKPLFVSLPPQISPFFRLKVRFLKQRSFIVVLCSESSSDSLLFLKQIEFGSSLLFQTQ